jgi:transcriptional regulator GlxA family with amidase domain
MYKIILSLSIALFCLNVQAQHPLSISAQNASKKDTFAFFCPPCGSDCDAIAFEKEGKCLHCNMALVKQSLAERRAQHNEKPLTIGFYLQNGVEILDFAGPMEVFAYAGFNIFTISRTKDPIVSQGILKIMPDFSIADAPPSDILAFFGGNTGVASNDSAVINWINNRKSTTDYYFSVCTGAFILGKTGLLDNLTATTFHLSIDALKKALPKTTVLSDVRFVDNGKVITTAGISAGIDGALHLVAKLKGEKAAIDVAKYMEYDNWTPNKGLILNKQ